GDAITRMVNASVAGDTLLVFMSNHGGVNVPRDGSGRTTSYLTAGDGIPVTDAFFRKTAEQFLSKRCKMTVILDCCHSSPEINSAERTRKQRELSREREVEEIGYGDVGRRKSPPVGERERLKNLEIVKVDDDEV
ncbi:hypothetical protein L195_g046052, partial [Trifolium pratense]